MRVLFLMITALYSAAAIPIMVLDIPAGAPCGSGQLYNASNSPRCQDKHCDSGVAFGFDIDGKEPCCITCDTPVPVCYKSWSHVTQMASRPDLRIDEICTPGHCKAMVAKETNKIIQSTVDMTPTPADTCAMFDHPGHKPLACDNPVFPSSQCWAMPSESSGSSGSWGFQLGFLQFGAMLLLML